MDIVQYNAMHKFVGVLNAVFCEERRRKSHVLFARITYKNVDCLQNGSVHELNCLKAFKISKVQTRSKKINNEPCKSSEYENPDKILLLLTLKQAMLLR